MYYIICMKIERDDVFGNRKTKVFYLFCIFLMYRIVDKARRSVV